jgi:hypothetical protein
MERKRPSGFSFLVCTFTNVLNGDGHFRLIPTPVDYGVSLWIEMCTVGVEWQGKPRCDSKHHCTEFIVWIGTA